MKKIYSLMLFLFFLAGITTAQNVATYSFAAGTGGALDPMAGSTQLVAAASDDGISPVTPIGFSFNYGGTAYTQFSANANGLVRLGATAIATGSTGYTNTAANAGSNSPAIMPYWDDLATGTNGKVHYILSGSAPNRVLIIEFYLTVPRATAVAATAKFQCLLFETSNVIKFVYGAGLVANTGGYSIGLATSSTIYNVVTSSTNTNSTTAFNTTNTTAITSGTTYTFTPPALCTGTPVAGTVIPASQNLCSGTTPAALTLSGSSSASGLTIQWEQASDAAFTTAVVNAVGGTGSTTATYTPPAFAGTNIYYRAKVTCTTSALFSYSNVASVLTAAAPSLQASAIVASAISTTSATISFTAGNGGRRYVEINTVNSFTDPTTTADPAAANTVYSGTGEQVVYAGTGTSVSVTGLTQGTAYYVRVYEYLRCTGTPNVNYYNVTTATGNPGTFTTVLPPANDDCANATTLVCNAAAIPGTTVGSVSETALPGACASLYGVWYKFTGDGSIVTITSVAGAGYDHEIDLFSGTCGALTSIVCKDGALSAGTETYTFTSVSGTQYYVYVAHYSPSSTTTGTFTIGISCVSCATPTALSSTAVTGTSANITFTGTGAAFIVEYGPAGFVPGTGAAAGAGTIVTGAASPISITGLMPSTSYDVYVRQDCSGAGNGYSTNSTKYVLTTTVACPAPTAVSSAAVTSTSANITFTGTGAAFIVEYGPAGFVPGTGAAAGAGTIVTGAASPISITGLTPSTSYDVYVRQDCSGAGNGYSANSTKYILTTTLDCSLATVVTCGTSYTTGVLGTTGGVYNSSTCFSTPGKETIYSYTPTQTGNYTLQVTNLNGTTGYIDYIYKNAASGCGPTGWTCIKDFNAIGTSSTFTLTAGVTYFILADAESTTSGSNQTFQIICPSLPPSCTTNTTPADLATNVSTIPSVTFTWAAAAGATSYDLYVGSTAAGATLVANYTTTTANVVGFSASTTYFWYVIPKNSGGSATGCVANATNFTTAVQCNPSTSNGGSGSGDGLTDFILNGESGTAISVTGAAAVASPGYTNLTATTTVDLAVGKAYAGKFKTEDAGDYVTIWIDFNNNGGFETNERVLNNLKPLGTATTSPYSILIPATATPGMYKMRVRNIYYSATPTAATDPCSNYTFGEGKDFTVNIIASGTPYVLSSVGAAACAQIAKTTIDVPSNNTTYDVPVLDATGAIVASLNANGNTLGTITASLYRNTSGTVRQDGVGVKYLDRNFTITPATQPAAGTVAVKLYYSAAELAALQAVDPSATSASLNCTKTQAACAAAWVTNSNLFLGQTGNGVLGADYYEMVNVPSFSSFFLHTGAVALPISLEYFRGSKQPAGNVLDWKVSSSSASMLTLERSTDKINYKAINAQTATMSQMLAPFSYTDATPEAGVNYYRLKVTNADGESKYSNVVALINKDKGFELISVVPNPVQHSTVLSLSSAKAGMINIAVSDVMGKVVMKQSVKVIAGNNPITLNFANLAAGTYQISAINAEGESKTTRFVKF